MRPRLERTRLVGDTAARRRPSSIWLGVPVVSAILALAMLASGPALAQNKAMPRLVPFQNSPFPFQGEIPESGGIGFLQTDPDGRQFHLSPRGGKLFVDKTYSDRRSLLYLPLSFDPRAPGAAILLFFHGNLATLHDVEGRQGVPRQLAASKLNAALVAPQLAVNALDSSAGRFWERGFLERYLDEAATHLAEISGARFTKAEFDGLPVIVVAYSGGYLATAFSLHYAAQQERPRIKGVVLLDALFGEEPKFAAWIGRARSETFFVSAYSNASAPLNEQLRGEFPGLVATTLPDKIGPGTIVFKAAPEAVHNDFVTQAWTRDPLALILKRIKAGG